MTRIRSAKAFTLVEALVALVLLAVVVPVALRAVSVSTHAASIASDRTWAVMLAETRLDELVATGNWQTTGLEGSFDDLFDQGMFGDASAERFGRFTWSAELEDWDAGDAQQLHVTVHWERRGAEHAVTLTTLVQEVAR